MRLLAWLGAALAVALAAALPASAATVSSDGTTLRVAAAPGEVNVVTITRDAPFGAAPTLTVRDEGVPPVATGPCTPTLDPAAVTCPADAIARAEATLGDQDDALTVLAPLRVRASGGPGTDVMTGGAQGDTLSGDAGDDELAGGGGADVVDGGSGDDDADGGPGNDRIVMRDRKADTAVCGPGRDRVRAEVLDQLDLTCEVVDYGTAGQRGRLASHTGGGRFVAVPGQLGTRVDRRILPDVLYLVRRYHLRLGDGFAVNGNHAKLGEHPLGLAIDIYPGPGGSWNQIDRLAKWAEPRQNHPRPPFRWVGYNGDYNHGRGNHLHLSWMHSAGRPGRPVRSVWAWAVHGAAAADR
jgi:RTX calcium-binding nonapeptide repeat (4 copies)